MKDDKQYEDVTIRSVDVHADEGFVINTDMGSLFVENKDKLEPPKEGDVVRFYGKGLGFPVRGVVVGDTIYYYQTAQEYDDEQKKKQEAQDAESRKQWDEGYEKFCERVNKLPECMRERITFFLRNPDWGWKFGGYELFVCEQAALFAEHFKTLDGIKEFHDKPYEEQRAELPEMSDGHSGNTFGAACHIACLLIDHPEFMAKVHGALCPLVGCKEYGCWSQTEEAKKQAAEREQRDV